MPSHKAPIPPPPQPTRIFFDPFNSSSTGHQRAENRLSGSTSWRESRTYKLSKQLKDASGGGGATHLSDLVGAGSEFFGKDGRKENGDWEKGAPGLREKGWQDIRGLMSGNRKRPAAEPEHGLPDAKKRDNQSGKCSSVEATSGDPDTIGGMSRGLSDSSGPVSEPVQTEPPPQIFRDLTMYLNGSTAPLVSDHKIKQLFVQHGGNSSFALGRRTVTHVIIGNTCGGGLASGKINKEIITVGGKGIRYVTAQWVMDSIEKGIRQPEARYVPKTLEGRLGGNGQGSVRTMFKPVTR